MAIERLSVVLELISGNYKKEAREAANATGQIGNSAKSVTGQLGAMIGPAAIAGAVVGLGKMALAAGENADRLFDLAAQTGLSTDELQRWEFVAKAAGATTEVFSDAVKAVIENLDGTAGATGAAAKAYEALGISVKDANGNLREGGEITAEVFDKLAAMTNITERNALAQDLFGKKWEETISILDLGSEALGNLREEGKKGVVSAEALRNADKFRESWQKLLATIGPKLNEMLGRIAPSLTEIADEAANAVEELAPFVEQIITLGGWVLRLRRDTDDMSESQSGFNRFIGEGVDVLEGFINPLKSWDNLMGVINPKVEENVAVVSEAHDSWTTAGAAAVALAAALGPTIAMLDNQNRSHRNVAAAADTQRRAMINLANAQADLLDPIANVIRLQRDHAAALERLKDVQNDSKSTTSDLALAALDAEQAFLRLQAAGAALTSDQVQAFALVLIEDLGMSERQALDTLAALNLLKGWHGEATFTLRMNEVASGGGGTGNINSILPQRLHSGGVVPGPWGSEQLILAQGGEGITPLNQMGRSGGGSTTIVVQSPMGNFRQDLQYATILASVTNLVEGF